MKATDFCYWLQGHFELNDNNQLNEAQVKMIRAHLNLVFKHDIDQKENAKSHLSPEDMQKLHDGVSNFDPHTTLLRC